MDNVSGTLISRSYNNFRGVDFSNKEVSLSRSPYSLNMYKNYKNSLGKLIETRPDIELVNSYDNTVYGHFFYKVGNIMHEMVHSGTKLYDNGVEKYVGMNIRRTLFFVFNNILYIKDGINYLEYNGETISEVQGTIPLTTRGKSPNGGDGEKYQGVNLLTGVRKNSFVADGTSKEYCLDSQDIDSNYTEIVIVDGTLMTKGTDFNVDTVNGKVIFNIAPSMPSTPGTDNVFITFRKTIQGHRDRINKCTLLTLFDNRVFFSGNQDYPNVVFHSELEDPRYIRDDKYYNEGLDPAPVKTMIAGNNALWILKEPNQANTTIFYHTPQTDYEYGKIYPSYHSSISTGCLSTGINFNDDIVFFSGRGMEGISGDINSEQLLAHRSSLVDNKLLAETNYKNLILEEWEGYLLVIVDNKVYLADSRQMFNNNNHNEYEWFYWELSKSVVSTCVNDGTLYLGCDDGIYSLTKTNPSILSVWTTLDDDFKYPQYQKTTNKRGGVANVSGDTISVDVKTDNNEFSNIGNFINTKGYIVYKIKKKKFKSIQLKFSSTKPFGLFDATLECFIGAYVKR